MGYYRERTRGRLGAAPPPTAQVATVPASVGGVNALDSIAGMPPEDCIYTYNLMPAEVGQQLRKGYREWATGVNGDVRTIINFEAQEQDASTDRLWAVSPNGIYNVTTYGTTAPTQDVTFATTTGQSGYGVKCEFTSDARTHYLFYADGENGIHQYEEGAGWSIPTGWTYDLGNGSEAFPVGDVRFVMVHKLRIWVILKDSTDAWYLPIASVAGALKKFSFGSKMPRGGNLMLLHSWTIDGGDGMDDYLLAVSRGGDVAVYRGDDPEAIDPSYTANGTWESTGIWFIGELPESRRVAIEYGAEVYILSVFGITAVRDLLQGSVSNALRNSPSAKVNRFLRSDIIAGKNRNEWALTTHPGDGFLQVVTPQPTSSPYLQYTQSLLTKAWGFWEGVPMVCAEDWNGSYFIGSTNGVVYIYDGELDNSTLDGTPGDPIQFRALTSFQSPWGAHSVFKRVGIIRPIGVFSGAAQVNVEAVYDYKVETILQSPIISPGGVSDVWDSGVWDTAKWDFVLAGASVPLGADGVGRVVAIGIAGNSANRINIVAYDVSATVGGFL